MSAKSAHSFPGSEATELPDRATEGRGLPEVVRALGKPQDLRRGREALWLLYKQEIWLKNKTNKP